MGNTIVVSESMYDGLPDRLKRRYEVIRCFMCQYNIAYQPKICGVCPNFYHGAWTCDECMGYDNK